VARSAQSGKRLRQRLRQVGTQVVDLLQTDRKAHDGPGLSCACGRLRMRSMS
jgi:hypothetical protein